MRKDLFANWKNRINWKQRVVSLCKPCWELKYCPYGPQVEHYPISQDKTNKSCIIFGHDCPVFYVAEPFTETKELRRISRYIPRDIQFKVVKRDNQICQECKRNVLDNEIEFDHIIPLSKGGSTEEYNIRLVCSDCNKKKSADFEDKYLVKSFFEHVMQPLPITFISALLDAIRFYHDFRNEKSKYPLLKDYNSVFKYADDRKIGDIVKSTVEKIVELLTHGSDDFFQGNHECMCYRWGFFDTNIHSVRQSTKKYPITLKDFFQLEINFVNQIGWYIERDEKDFRVWKKL